jgi:hypothetical protein
MIRERLQWEGEGMLSATVITGRDVIEKAAMGQDVMESVLSWDRMFFCNVNSAMLKNNFKIGILSISHA